MAKTNEFVSKTGAKITLNLSNQQEELRPGRYQYIDADLYSDICEALGETIGKTDALFKEVMRRGLETLNLNVDEYSLERATPLNIRNKSVNVKWIAKHEAETIVESQKKAVADKTINAGDVLVMQFRKLLETAITKTGNKLSNEQIEHAISSSKITDEQKKHLRNNFITATKPAKKDDSIDFGDFFSK